MLENVAFPTFGIQRPAWFLDGGADSIERGERAAILISGIAYRQQLEVALHVLMPF